MNDMHSTIYFRQPYRVNYLDTMFKNCVFRSRLLYPTQRNLCFQGHYINRYVKGNNPHCNCLKLLQTRSIFNFSDSNRIREHCGRQLIGYTMDQMYDVVSDVENYYKFVPWCKQSLVIQKAPDNLQAKLMIGFPPVNESYISHVTFVKPLLVKAECRDGKLFRHLLTLWRFSPGLKKEPKSCIVDFQITFEFRSAFHSTISNLFFDQVARQMEEAFIREVGRRNGPASMLPINLLKDGQTIKS